eukprot:TRINITY_DN1508_c1_g1_i1.p2 TRINITY_DN1508_c1_g1~~TRINITY_DN1508_c1_g1_i1.p2  ORF type:complete len:102 (-),score=38.66 TRINITY_DN1508_c1_g1_i1:55-360(-)
MAACGAEEIGCEAPVAATTEATACEPKYVKNKTVSGKKMKTKKMKAKNAADCWTRCTQNEACKYVTWVSKSKNKKLRNVCTFFKSKTKLKKKKGVIVGMCQ